MRGFLILRGEDAVELRGEIANELVELGLASGRRRDGEIAAAFREDLRDSLVRFDDAFQECNVLGADHEPPGDHALTDEGRNGAARHAFF